jgi:formate hydrogenlyase subunit 3/multisubunit Na+/H+ antiporter MnhD subunit
LGGWGPPLGIRLDADGVTVLFLLFHSVVAGVVGWVAAGEDEAPSATERSRLFWPLLAVAWAALNALVLSRDLFNLYVSLELISLAGVGLILLTGTAAAARAAIDYLLLALVGGLLYLLGVGFAYAAADSLDLAQVTSALVPGPLAETALVFLLIGLCIKSALFPVHTWLPPAHANARAPVSALLSGLVVTGAYIVVLRLWASGFRALAPSLLPDLLAGLGALGIVWGGWMAWRQERLKRILAYSTVSQTGYLFLVYGLGGAEAGPAAGVWAGTIALALGHGLSKAAAFLAAGMLAARAGSDRLDALRGSVLTQPVAVGLFALAAANLMGLPPGLGFLGKWLLFKAAFAQGQWALFSALLLGTVLAVMYLVRPLERMLCGSAPKPDEAGFREGALAALPVLGLALLPFIVSWWLSGPDSLLHVGSVLPALPEGGVP